VNDFIKSVRFKILVGILLVILGFMIMAVYTGGTASPFTQAVNFIVEPVQRLSANISGGIGDFLDKFLNAGEIYEQNALLRDEISELRKQLVDYEKIKHENEQYKTFMDVGEQRTDLTLATAAVIERDPRDAFNGFSIDKGSLDDVALYDPVMTSDGLVGYVTEVGLTTSKVATILDVNMNVGATNSATRDIGNVTGTVDFAAEGLCRMEFLPRDSATEPGHIIVTSGSSRFPKDIVIGVVDAVAASNQGNSLEATVKPAADIQRVKDVFVITHFEGQGIE
jgi:rod shape-determining protein MreC